MSGRDLVLVDTAGPVVAVAAYAGDALRLLESERIVAGADGWLTPALARALGALAGLDAVAVVTGPGAFTGLRVGLAQAVGLALARGVPMIPIPTLALRAASRPGEACVLALLDARKGRLYAQAFDTRGATPAPLGPAEDVSAAELAARSWPPGTVAVGEGLAVAGPLLDCVRGAPLPGGAYVGHAAALLAAIPAVDAAAVAPAYLREPDAQPPADARAAAAAAAPRSP